MKHTMLKSLLTAFVLAGASSTYAADPVLLTDNQMDSVSAGGYSYVYGAAAADSGSVLVKARTQGKAKPNGAEVSKSRIVVKANGSGLEGYAEGGSGNEFASTSGVGAAAVDQGKLTIVIRTKVKTKDGMTISRTRVKSKAMAPGVGSVISRSDNTASST